LNPSSDVLLHGPVRIVINKFNFLSLAPLNGFPAGSNNEDGQNWRQPAIPAAFWFPLAHGDILAEGRTAPGSSEMLHPKWQCLCPQRGEHPVLVLIERF